MNDPFLNAIQEQVSGDLYDKLLATFKPEIEKLYGLVSDLYKQHYTMEQVSSLYSNAINSIADLGKPILMKIYDLDPNIQRDLKSTGLPIEESIDFSSKLIVAHLWLLHVVSSFS